MWICIAPHREHTSKALGYGTCCQGISQFYIHTPRSSTNGMNHTCLWLPSWSWSLFTNPGGMEGWVALRGRLRTEINVWHQALNSDTVTHLSTNPARHRLTLLIETNALPLRNSEWNEILLMCYSLAEWTSALPTSWCAAWCSVLKRLRPENNQSWLTRHIGKTVSLLC